MFFWIYYLNGIITLIRYLFAFLLFINLSQSLFSKELLNSNFDNVTKNEINKLIKNYILDNPEIVIEAIELFQKKQSLNAIKKEKETIKSLSVELYDDTNSYFFGNENSKLKIVEFIDYNCGYCKKNHEIMMNILNKNNDIKYIIKELPILGESSLLASKFAINIYLVDGPKIYEKFYDKLMRHNSQLNFEILNKIAKKVGSSIKDFNSKLNVDSVNSVILKNLTLADKLSIDGTPTFIIDDNIFRGFISFDQLQEIIDNLRKKKYLINYSIRYVSEV